MNKLTAIALLISLTIPAIGKELLEFRFAQFEEKSGWEEMRFEGKPIWVNPACEIDSRSIAFAEATPGNSLYTTWLALSPEEQARMKNQYPDMIDQMSTNLPPPQITITFTPEGGKRIEKITQKHIGKQLAMVFEGKVLIAPSIHESISSGAFTIAGSFTETEAKEMVSKINKAIKSRAVTDPI